METWRKQQVASAAVTGLRAQQATFTGGSALVVVDVVAVDRSGQPITDLTADDFSVTFGGRPRAVQTLNVITSGTSDLPADASDVPAVHVSRRSGRRPDDGPHGARRGRARRRRSSG